jgi:hypothetical protein
VASQLQWWLRRQFNGPVCMLQQCCMIMACAAASAADSRLIRPRHIDVTSAGRGLTGLPQHAPAWGACCSLLSGERGYYWNVSSLLSSCKRGGKSWKTSMATWSSCRTTQHGTRAPRTRSKMRAAVACFKSCSSTTSAAAAQFCDGVYVCIEIWVLQQRTQEASSHMITT